MADHQEIIETFEYWCDEMSNNGHHEKAQDFKEVIDEIREETSFNHTSALAIHFELDEAIYHHSKEFDPAKWWDREKMSEVVAEEQERARDEFNRAMDKKEKRLQQTTLREYHTRKRVSERLAPKFNSLFE